MEGENIVFRNIDVENERIWRELLLHGTRVSYLCGSLGEAINLRKDMTNILLPAACYHDIGKLGVPENILFSMSKLNDEELKIIRKHPLYSYIIMSKIDCMKEYKKIALCHHERQDGSGYPNGLRGEDVPFLSRIIAICDVYDALTNDRSYRAAFSHEEAIELMQAEKQRYDSHLLTAFLNMIKGSRYKKAL